MLSERLANLMYDLVKETNATAIFEMTDREITIAHIVNQLEEELQLMSDNNGQPSITLHTRFRRNMKLADYEMAEAEISVDQTFPGDMAPEDIQAHVAGMFVYAKAGVYDQLGLSYNQDEATGLIMEAFPGAQVVESKASEAKPKRGTFKGPKSATAPKSIPEPYTDDDEPPIEAYEDEAPPPRPARQPARKATGGRPSGKAKAMSTEELWEHLESNPDEWVDNRNSKKNPKAPDYRSKSIPDPKNAEYKVGLWEPAPDWFENPYDD